MSSEKEKRIHEREDLILKVEYDNVDKFLHDYTNNFSRGGIFINTDKPLDQGTVIRFQISFPGLLEPLEMKGEVAWRKMSVTGDEEPDSLGMGVRFIFEDHSVIDRISQIAEKLRKEQRKPAASERPFGILVVDDNPNIHELLETGISRLKNTEALVYHASDGTEALRCTVENQIDLIIADIYMPIMDGVEFIRRVRMNTSSGYIPIIVISGGGVGMREMAIEAGADLYLAKPLTLRRLLNTIATLLKIGQ